MGICARLPCRPWCSNLLHTIVPCKINIRQKASQQVPFLLPQSALLLYELVFRFKFPLRYKPQQLSNASMINSGSTNQPPPREKSPTGIPREIGAPNTQNAFCPMPRTHNSNDQNRLIHNPSLRPVANIPSMNSGNSINVNR